MFCQFPMSTAKRGSNFILFSFFFSWNGQVISCSVFLVGPAFFNLNTKDSQLYLMRFSMLSIVYRLLIKLACLRRCFQKNTLCFRFFRPPHAFDVTSCISSNKRIARSRPNEVKRKVSI